MSVGDVVQAVIKYNAAYQIMVNVLHFRSMVAVGTDLADMTDLATALDDIITDEFPSAFGTPIGYDGVSLRGVTKPTLGYDIVHASVAGGLSGDILPPQSAPLILLRTGLIGRSYNGKVYLPPCVEADQAGGGLISAAQARFLAYIDAIIAVNTDITSGAYWELVVYSQKLGTAHAVTTRQCQAVIHTQRRRTPGRGI